MTMPTFLVIGAAKSGTDALCDYLDQHPDVFIAPTKEPNFFIAEGIGPMPYRGPGDRDTLRRGDMWVTTRPRYEAHVTYHRLVVGQSALKTVGKALLPAGIRQRVRQSLPQSRMVKPEPMPAEGRAALIDAFKEDVPALQRLLQRDLGRWLR
jgi:hypothetical protein